jgi:hypothetical protein
MDLSNLYMLTCASDLAKNIKKGVQFAKENP